MRLFWLSVLVVAGSTLAKPLAILIISLTIAKYVMRSSAFRRW